MTVPVDIAPAAPTASAQVPSGRRSLTLGVGLALVGLQVGVALLTLVWTPYDPTGMSGGRLEPPSLAHWLGTDRLGRDFFARGAPEIIPDEHRSAYDANLYDLLSAYAALRQRQAVTNVTIARRRVWSLAEARLMLARLVGALDEWTALDRFLIRYMADPEERPTVIASAFAATLELIREGHIEVRQHGAFTPIYMRDLCNRALRGPDDAITIYFDGYENGTRVTTQQQTECGAGH